MAISNSKSKTIYAPASSSYGYTLKTEFTETGTDAGANTSTITCSASIGASKIAYSVSDGGTLAVYWHDNNTNTDTLVKSITVSSCGNGGGSNYGTKTASGTITATHKSDGTLSGYSKAVFTKNKSNSYIPPTSNVSTDATDLTDIPRQATLNSATNFNDEGNPTITYSNPAHDAVSSLQVCIALNTSPTNPAIPYRSINRWGSSYTFSLTEAERNTIRNSIPNANSRNVFIFLKTELGGQTYYSYKVAVFSIVNAKPTIATRSYLDTNSTTTAVTRNNQILIQNKSTLQYNFTSLNALKGASLASLKIDVNGTIRTISLSGTSVASNSYNYGVVNVSNDFTSKVTITDTRGNYTTYNVPLKMWEYYNPSAIVQCSREANYYSNCTINVDANYASLNNTNTIAIKFRMKKKNTQTWGDWETISDNTPYNFTADNEFAWDIQVNLVDILGTSTTYTISKAIDVGTPLVFYDVKRRSVGVNCIPLNNGSCEINGFLALAAWYGNGQNSYIKFENGLMFQWMAYNASVTMATTGNVAYGDVSMPNWPQPFTTIHFAIPINTNVNAWCAMGNYSITSAGTVRIYRPTIQDGTYYIRVFAVGRWKE